MLIENKYELEEIIGSGKFGKIVLGKNKYTKEKVAIKMELIDELITLRHEAKIYEYLNKKKLSNICLLKSFGKIDNYNYLILEYCEEKLEEFYENEKKKNNIFIKLIEILKQLHSLNIIHRDIKPENFMVKNKKIMLVDFGLSRCYYLNRHIEKVKRENSLGTIIYTSINNDDLWESSRRDDLESLGYVMLYLNNNNLPWKDNNIKDENKIKYIKKDRTKNINITKESFKFLNGDNNLNEKLIEYIFECRRLKFEETPDYNNLIKIISVECRDD